MSYRKIAATAGAVVSTAVIVFALIFAFAGSRRSPESDVHRNVSIEMAFNWVECGEYASVAPGGLGMKSLLRGTFYEGSDVETVERPLRELAETRSGELAEWSSGSVPAAFSGVAAYCDLPFEQGSNEDSSLFYLFSFLLRLWSDASLAQLYTLATAFVAVGFSLTGLATWMWFRSGVLSAGIVLAEVLWYSHMTVHRFMANSLFGWVFLLLAAFLMAWGISQVSTGRFKRAAAIIFAAGLMAAFAANMRSTVLPEIPLLIIAMGVGVAASIHSGGGNWWRSRKIGHAGALVAVFAIAWFGYGRIAVGPLESNDTGELTSHPVGHPLTLGLAVPYSDFARDLGIIWLDARGLEIAEEYRPGSTATMRQYEDAIFDYYVDLWQDRPGDMMRTYWDKANVTGTSLLPLQRDLWIGWISPLNLVPNGLILGLILGLCLVWSFMVYVGSPPVIFLMRSLLISLVGGYFVSMVIFPLASLYVPELHFALIVITLVFWWAVVRIALMASLRYGVTQDGWIGGNLRLAYRWW